MRDVGNQEDISTEKSRANESEIDFLKRAGREVRDFSDRNEVEGCGKICVTEDPAGVKSYAIKFTTNDSHIGCATGPCADGYKETGETLHSHGTSSTVRANVADEVLSGGKYLQGTRISGQDLFHFSAQDFATGAGYLAAPHDLLYQKGERNQIDYGN